MKKPASLRDVLETLDALPAGTMLDAEAVAGWLAPLVAGCEPVATADKALGVDLSVQEVASAFNRGASTIRAWLADGRFPNAYQLRGKEWRIPRDDVEAMQRAERERFKAARAPVQPTDDAAELGSWRQHYKKAG